MFNVSMGMKCNICEKWTQFLYNLDKWIHFTLTLKETTTMHLRHAQPHQIQLSVPHTPYPRKQEIKRLNNSFPAPTAHHHRQHREKQWKSIIFHAFEAKNTRISANIVVKIALKSLMNIFMKAFKFYVRGQSESFAVDA